MKFNFCDDYKSRVVTLKTKFSFTSGLTVLVGNYSNVVRNSSIYLMVNYGNTLHKSNRLIPML